MLVVGYTEERFSVNYQDIMKNEKEIIGVRGSTAEEMIEVINLVEKKKITPFIHQVYPFMDINKALQDLREGKNLGRLVLIME